MGKHVDEGDFFDGEVLFENGEVASEARGFAGDVEDELRLGAAEIACELWGEPVSSGVADDDVGGFGIGREAGVEVVEFEGGVGVRAKGVGIMRRAVLEGVGGAKELVGADVGEFSGDAESEVSRAGEQIGGGRWMGEMFDDVVEESSEQRVYEGVCLGESLGEIADAPVRRRRREVGQRNVCEFGRRRDFGNERFAVVRTRRDDSGKYFIVERLLGDFFDEWVEGRRGVAAGVFSIG